ncbi:MAG: hypothetical protein IT419_07975 [Planctomycetes bacterium]|nr:hypothetical protein [Planctomycetota bacterium]
MQLQPGHPPSHLPLHSVLQAFLAVPQAQFAPHSQASPQGQESAATALADFAQVHPAQPPSHEPLHPPAQASFEDAHLHESPQTLAQMSPHWQPAACAVASTLAAEAGMKAKAATDNPQTIAITIFKGFIDQSPV